MINISPSEKVSAMLHVISHLHQKPPSKMIVDALSIKLAKYAFSSADHVHPVQETVEPVVQEQDAYSINISTKDLALLDSLAASMNVTRSLLLNKILHDILLDELTGIEELDVKLLLAQAADNLTCYNNMDTPWTYDVLDPACATLSRNIDQYNTMALDVQPPHHPEEKKENFFNSDAYLAMKNALVTNSETKSANYMMANVHLCEKVLAMLHVISHLYQKPPSVVLVEVFSAKLAEYASSSEHTQVLQDSVKSMVQVQRMYTINPSNVDLALLDSLAASMSVSRSLLLNDILHDILLDELASVEELDAKLLLAQTADKLAYYSNMATPWIYDVLSPACGALCGNIFKYNTMALDVQPPWYPEEMNENFFNSEVYLAIKNTLEGIEK